jgi:hypothetical protein
MLLAGCGDAKTPASSHISPDAATEDVAPAADHDGTMPSPGATSGGSAAAPAGMGGRTRELVNPDHATMVFLYHDLAGLPPPMDKWIEDDRRVAIAPAAQKAALRTTIRAELQSGMTAVRDVGLIRLSMNANLSDYDPSYGEFTIRALAPSSMVEFSALGQKVSLKFSNGRTAQMWRVPPDQAQAVKDRIGYGNRVTLDALLRIADVQPGPGGGTITTEVVEYDLRDDHSGATLARVGLIDE